MQISRQSGVPAWDSIWAEDGTIFLEQASEDSFLAAVADPYSGYVHVVPRLIAEVAVLLPIEHAALTVSVASSLLVAALSLFVYFASGEAVADPLRRLFVASLMIFAPTAGYELLANAANLHWYFLFACFWAVVWRATSGGALLARSSVVAATALSDPLSALYIPLAAFAVWRGRTRRDLVVPAALALGLLAQFAAFVGGGRPERHWPTRIDELLDIFALRVAGSILVGDRYLENFWLRWGETFAYVSLALVALAAVAVFLAWQDARIAQFCVVYAVAFFTVPLVFRGTEGFRPIEGEFHLGAGRYMFLPTILLITAFALSVGQWRRLTQVAPPAVGAILLTYVATIAIVNYSSTNPRSPGPRWGDEVERARSTCVGTVPEARLQIAPAPTWSLVLPCSELK